MARRILVIDDDPDLLEIFRIIFDAEGYEVIISRTGEEVDYIGEINPDLILLDIRISQTRNGITLCSQLKANPETAIFPVLLVSAERNLSELAAQCGADGFIVKPFNVPDLAKKVRSVFE